MAKGKSKGRSLAAKAAQKNHADKVAGVKGRKWVVSGGKVSSQSK